MIAPDLLPGNRAGWPLAIDPANDRPGIRPDWSMLAATTAETKTEPDQWVWRHNGRSGRWVRRLRRWQLVGFAVYAALALLALAVFVAMQVGGQ